MLAFRLTKDAVRFCHACQAALLLREWSAEALAFFPRPVLGPDDRSIMAGPPVAMAIHESTSYRYAWLAGPACMQLMLCSVQHTAASHAGCHSMAQQSKFALPAPGSLECFSPSHACMQ